MGVCKCKQRNVTNQFCYVCRMNVCESCMVKDHPRCIIKSYVHWLQDSDYSATCSLCLDSIQTGEVIRLACYDLFHWDCFNAWALRQQGDPSTYQCPDCKAQVFPRQNLLSPVADVVRQRFSTVAWGKRGLGLPQDIGSQPSRQVEHPTGRPITPSSIVNDIQVSTSTPLTTYKPISETIKTPFVPMSHQQEQNYMQQQAQQQQQQQQQHVPSTTNKYSRDSSVSRKIIDTRHDEDAKINMLYDHDDHKYKRKGFMHWFKNMLRLNQTQSPRGLSTQKKEGNMTFKRTFILLVLISLGFMTMVYFMSVLGRKYGGGDPMLNPDLNPHLKVERQVGGALPVSNNK